MNVHVIEDKNAVRKELVVNPNGRNHEFKVELGGTIVLMLPKNSDVDTFEIIFTESWPPTARQHFTGSEGTPIEVPMPKTESEFKGHIFFKKKDGTRENDGVPFLAKSCPGC